MKSLFWTGKLSLPVTLLVNANNLIAFLNGNSGDKPAMKERVKLGYRFEFWSRTEKQILNLMKDAGFEDVRTDRFIWRNLFNTPTEACEFFAAVTANWIKW